MEDEQLAGAHVVAEESGGRQDRPEVRILRRGDGRRDADEDDIGIADRRLGLGRDSQTPVDRSAQSLVGDVVDRRATRPEDRHALLGDVDAIDVEAGLRERDGEREPDITETDDGHALIRAHVGSFSILESREPPIVPQKRTDRRLADSIICVAPEGYRESNDLACDVATDASMR